MSGQKIKEPIVFEIRDGLGNLMNLDSSSVLTLQSVSSGKVSGTTDVGLLNGKAQFDDITLEAIPGST